MWALPVVEYLGLNPRYIDGTMLGGSSFIAHLLPAMQAHPRPASAAPCWSATAARSAAPPSAGARSWRRAASSTRSPTSIPYEPMLPVSAYALAASRHMHEFGTTREQLADVAVAARAWARLNPEAFMREPLTRERRAGRRAWCRTR